MAKIEVANTLFLVCFEIVFVFPGHCAFCLCEVLMRCHRYVIVTPHMPSFGAFLENIIYLQLVMISEF